MDWKQTATRLLLGAATGLTGACVWHSLDPVNASGWGVVAATIIGLTALAVEALME